MTNGFAKLQNEAAVELWVIVPLLQSLGYDLADISPKHSVTFQEGRKGRKHEADFVLFAGPVRNRYSSLVVVEAKPPGKNPDEARRQAESYAFAIGAPLVLFCDGVTLKLWQFDVARKSEQVLSILTSEIEGKRSEIERYLRKEAVVAYCRNLPHKRIVEVTDDFGAYEVGELRRTLGFAREVSRRLKNQGSEEKETIGSPDLLGAAGSGAVIVAASGYGKTSLSNTLLRAQLSACLQEGRGRVAVHASLPDLRPEESIWPAAGSDDTILS